MSYCRFSSDDFQCDVYCYESSSGGFDIFVASNRVTFTEPTPPPVDLDDIKAYLHRHNLVTEMVRQAERSPIGLAHDGAFFNEPTAVEAAKRLEWLRDIGYTVPQYAIDALRAESTPPTPAKAGRGD